MRNQNFGNYQTVSNSVLTTGTASFNTSVGVSNLSANNASGVNNSAFGYNALNALSTGGSNTAVGFMALASNLSGSQNVAIGNSALQSLVTGTNNTALGFLAGSSYISNNSNNISIGANVLGTAGESNAVRLGGPTNTNYYIGTISTTVSTANLFLNTATGEIQRSLTSAGITWGTITSSATVSANTGWIVTSGTVSLGLPTISALGSQVSVILAGGNQVALTQAAGQSILFGSTVTTTGTAGSVTSTSNGDALTIICTLPNTSWAVNASQGNWTVA